jgi:hypothetical protein
MPSVGFEPAILASERAKTVHALDCSATVTGSLLGWAGLFHSVNYMDSYLFIFNQLFI